MSNGLKVTCAAAGGAPKSMSAAATTPENTSRREAILAMRVPVTGR
jgi:hypothetical protein